MTTDRRCLLSVVAIMVATLTAQVTIILWRPFGPAPVVGCWEAPREALEQQRSDEVIADGHWMRWGSEPPLYCVEWLRSEFTQTGRMTLADRCWAARELSAEECTKSPGVSP